MSYKKIKIPFENEEIIKTLRAGERVLLTGTMYAARDAAHKRMMEQMKAGKALPIPLENQVIYYVGPTPAKPGEVIGSAGPTTSSRMDKYTPELVKFGIKGMIGNGYRSQTVIDSLIEYNAVYFAAIGGSGALLAKRIKQVELIAYEDLGTEAIRKLTVRDFPCIVINDTKGNDWYKQSQESYKRGIDQKSN